MEKIKIKQIAEMYNLTHSAVSQWFLGLTKPRYEIMVDLHRRGIVPFDAWLDIKAYLNDSANSAQETNTKKGEKV